MPNPTFRSQVEELIKTYGDPETLADQITAIHQKELEEATQLAFQQGKNEQMNVIIDAKAGNFEVTDGTR